MKKIGIIGNSEAVRGFGALGLTVFELDDLSDFETASHTIRTLADSDFAIIYIVEALYEGCRDEISRYSDRQLPAIIPIPGTVGNTGIGMRRVGEFVERAVGSDIIS